MILSDMPQTQKGSWFLHYRDKMDVESMEFMAMENDENRKVPTV